MLKKRTRKDKEAPPDVRADDPVGTMNRFTDGLKRVLAKPKAKQQADTNVTGRDPTKTSARGA